MGSSHLSTKLAVHRSLVGLEVVHMRSLAALVEVGSLIVMIKVPLLMMVLVLVLVVVMMLVLVLLVVLDLVVLSLLNSVLLLLLLLREEVISTSVGITQPLECGLLLRLLLWSL